MSFGITEGASLLRQFLTAQGINVPTFAEKHSLCRIQVQRALNGERKKISVDFALAIQRATNGAVPMASWARNRAASAEAA